MKHLTTLLVLAIAASTLAQNPKKVPGSTIETVEEIVIMGGEMYYSAHALPGFDPVPQKFRNVPASGVASANINTGFLTDMADLTVIGDRIYFRGKNTTCSSWTLHYYSVLDGIVALTDMAYPLGVPSAHIFAKGSILYNYGRHACPFADHPFMWSYDGTGFTSLYESDPMMAEPFPTLNITVGKTFVEYGGLTYYDSGLELSYIDLMTVSPVSVFTSSTAIFNLTVHDGKLWFAASDAGSTRDLYSYDGTTVVKEVDLPSGAFAGVVGSLDGRFEPFLSVGSDLYFSASFSPPSAGVFYKFDGTDTTRIADASSQASGLFGGEPYFTTTDAAVVGHHVARLESGLPRLVTGWTCGSCDVPSPRLYTEYLGSLYFANSGSPTPSTGFGLYVYDGGLVIDAMDTTSVGPCDPLTSTYDVTVEWDYHGSIGGGTFEFDIVNSLNDDTIMVSVPETSAPQSHTFSLPVLYPTGFMPEHTILVPEYVNASDPEDHALAIVSDIDVAIPLPCIPCDLSVEFTDQTCTAPGLYDQTLIVSWDTAYTPGISPSTMGVDITVNGVTMVATSEPWTFVIDDLPGDGSYATFDISLDGVSSSPCMLTDSVVSPDCTCKMDWEYGPVVACDPGTSTYSQEFTLTYEFEPAGSDIDFGLFIAPATGSPQTVVFSSLPADGLPFGTGIVFVDDPTCGTIVEWISPLPDCTPAVDCPGLLGDIGDPCDDGDPTTGMDTITPSCTCEGTPLDCEGVPGGPATPGTPCDDGDPSTTMDLYLADCTCAGTPSGANDLSLVITTDDMGGETSWEILPDGSMTPVCSGMGYPSNSVITETCSVADGCYSLKVYDSMGDGMFTGDMGGYVLYDGSGSRIIDNEADGDFGAVSTISGSGTFCVPLGTDRLIFSSCDKEERLATDFVIASSNPAVAAEYGGPDEATSGYQFWMFDPDGTYFRKVFISHANPTTGVPAGPVAAAHMRPSHLNTLPPPADVLLNVRVRSRVAGVNSAYGPACRFKIVSTPTACPTTQLIDDPSSFAYSCGVMKTFGGSDKIYAEPIAGANKYQFRFENASEGFLRHIAFSSYVCVLNWITAPLTEGTTYDVSVRASFNGGATYCDWGDACSVTIMPTGPSFSMRSADMTSATRSVFPNPNDGRSVWIAVGDQVDREAPVNIAVLDMTGKVIERTNMVNSPSPTVVEFNDRLTPGTYLILIEQGGSQHHERLVVH